MNDPSMRRPTDTVSEQGKPTRLPSAGQYVEASGRPHEADLSNCDREPIHVPNLIQPHGLLIVLAAEGGEGGQAERLRVVQTSANTEALCGRRPADLVGRTTRDLFGKEADARLREAASTTNVEGNPVRLLTTRFACDDGEAGGQAFDVVVHRYVPNTADGVPLVVAELEATETAGDAWSGKAGFDAVRRVLVRLLASDDLQTFCDTVADEVRRISGFDRVMVYRFDRDYNGEVVSESIAEERQGTLEPFVKLHYPASDIPAQARQLYLKNWLRIIPDIGYMPAGLVPEDLSQAAPGAPRRLDMSHCLLRSVSPLHVEYLKNMEVSATMTVSLVDGSQHGEEAEPVLPLPVGGTAIPPPSGRLWGLIACHHYSPRSVSYEVRAACELVGQLVSMQLSTKEAGQAVAAMSHRRDVQRLLLHRLTDDDADFSQALVGSTGEDPGVTAADLVRCGGAAVVVGRQVRTVGDTPPARRILDVARFVARSTFGDSEAYVSAADLRRRQVFQTDRLADLDAGFTDLLPTAAGVLAVPLNPAGGGVYWFRPEQVRDVHWAGDPDKAVEVSAAGGGGETPIRLSPRKSFKKWKQQVRGRSLPWEPAAVLAAEELRDALVDIVLRRAHLLADLNSQLEMSNKELDDFAYVASHDLREPLRGLNNLAHFLIEDQGSRLDEEGRHHLDLMIRLTARMESLIQSLLHFSRVGRLDLDAKPVDLNQTLTEARELLALRFKESKGRLEIPRPLPSVQADPTRVLEIFTNLLSNALKYNDKPVRVVEVGHEDDHPGVSPDPDTGRKHVALYVRDDGIGIDTRYHEDIFRIFKRLHPRGAYGGGTGAGLTIVQRLVHRHGGRVWLDSEPGHGTTFWFTLGPS